MSGTKLRILAIGTAVVVGGAFFAVRSRYRGPELVPPGAAIPGLKASINDVASLTVLKNTGSVTLARTGAGENAAWTVPAKDGFPADLERLRTTLIQLSNLELSQPQTSNPEFYSKLGVQDVAVLPKDADESAKKAAAPGALVEVKDASGKTIGALIIGNAAEIGNATLDRPMESGQFVRKPGATQSWLTRSTIYVDAEPMNWIDRKVVGLPREQIKRVTVRRLVGTGPSAPGGNADPDLVLSRPDKDTPAFEAAGLPAGAQLRPGEAADQPVQTIAYLGMDDVMKDPGGVIGNPDPQASGPDAAHPTNTQFETFDGLIVTVKTGFRDGKWWAQVGADAGADPIPGVETKDGNPKATDASKEAEAINKRTSGWLFAISQFDAKRLSPRLEEMIAPPTIESSPPAVGPAAEPGSIGTPLPPPAHHDVPNFPVPVPK